MGERLKSLFAELTSGPMPDHLLALVDQLESVDPPRPDPAEDEAAAPPPR